MCVTMWPMFELMTECYWPRKPHESPPMEKFRVLPVSAATVHLIIFSTLTLMCSNVASRYCNVGNIFIINSVCSFPVETI